MSLLAEKKERSGIRDFLEGFVRQRVGKKGPGNDDTAKRPPAASPAQAGRPPAAARPSLNKPIPSAATPPERVKVPLQTIQVAATPARVTQVPANGTAVAPVEGTTAYHAKYFAHEITRLAPGGDVSRLSQSLFDACVDLQPHQIEAGLFALRSPLSKGVMLADEVGLGKTIEAGLVLCQFWAERKRKLLVVCPASIRKQWQLELTQKFNLPTLVLDGTEYKTWQRKGYKNPFQQDQIVIVSYHFASRWKDDVEAIPWDLAVVDEAHRLRNANTQASQNLRAAIGPVRKLLLTATPLQNNLAELYTLASFIDPRNFGDKESFQLQYSGKEADLEGLKARLEPFVKRTLRKQVLEYIRYTQRHAITVTFDPDAPENRLYEEVSEFLQREETYALPTRQRHLMVLLLRKILASSSTALAATLEKMKRRLEGKLTDQQESEDGLQDLLEDEVLDEEEAEELPADEEEKKEEVVDPVALTAEVATLQGFIDLARSIHVDSKSKALLKGLEQGFAKMKELRGPRKALVFTESRRTQAYLKHYLEANGYAGQIVLFNGTNNEKESKAIYEKWLIGNEPLGRASGNRNIDQRTALIEHFEKDGTIMLATEAAGEGVNLQFCALVLNYDLPWNPQRIEQRIGRCHRYGQKHDVVVVNFLNSKNHADQRVLELLGEKFHLFKGVFGSSDEVLGALESGVDFERKVLGIYQQCRSAKEIDAAFEKLRFEMEEQIKTRMEKVRQALLEHFDQEVHSRFKNFLGDAQQALNDIERMFWRTTKHILGGSAEFDDRENEFHLRNPPRGDIPSGSYRLITRSASGRIEQSVSDRLYRISHPLGEYVLNQAKTGPTPPAEVVFDVSHHPTKISAVAELKGKAGWAAATKLSVRSYATEEHLMLTGITDAGEPVDSETLSKMFQCAASTGLSGPISQKLGEILEANYRQQVESQLAKTLEANNAHFDEEQERLEQWAEDRKTSARNLVDDLELKIKDLRRQARMATNLKDRLEFKEKEKQAVEQQKRAQKDVFSAFDEINQEMEGFIEGLQKQLDQQKLEERLFTIRWRVV